MPERYSESYMRNHCIDVFFRYKDIPIHVLTCGNLLPYPLNDLARNRKIQQQQAIRLEQIEERGGFRNEIRAQESYINYIRHQEQNAHHEYNQEDFTSWFLPYAELGYYTYDCIEFNDVESLFRLVAIPKEMVDDYRELPVYDNLNVLNYLDDGKTPESFLWSH